MAERPDPPVWGYQPRRQRRQAALAAYDELTRRAQDHVASGDPAGILRAKQLLTAPSAQKKSLATRESQRKKIADAAKAELERRQTQTGNPFKRFVAEGLNRAADAVEPFVPDRVERGVSRAIDQAKVNPVNPVAAIGARVLFGETPLGSDQTSLGERLAGAPGRALGNAFDGREILDNLARTATQDRVGLDDVVVKLTGKTLDEQPRLARELVSAISPATFATGLAGKPLGNAIRALPVRSPLGRRVLGGLANVVEPFSGRFPVAREIGASVAGNIAAEEVQERVPGPFGQALGLGAGIVAGGAAGASPELARGLGRAVSSPIINAARPKVVAEAAGLRHRPGGGMYGGYHVPKEEWPDVIAELDRIKAPIGSALAEDVKIIRTAIESGRLDNPSMRVSDALENVYLKTAYDPDGVPLELGRARAKAAPREPLSPAQKAQRAAVKEGEAIGKARRAEAEALIEADPSLKGWVRASAEGIRVDEAPTETGRPLSDSEARRAREIDRVEEMRVQSKRLVDDLEWWARPKHWAPSDPDAPKWRSRAGAIRRDLRKLESAVAGTEKHVYDQPGYPAITQRYARLRDEIYAARPTEPGGRATTRGSGTREDPYVTRMTREQIEAEAAARRPQPAPETPAPRTRADDFLDTLEPKRAGRARKTLAVQRRDAQDGVRSRGARIEAWIDEGATVREVNGEARLTRPSGVFISEKDLTKTGMDYARYLEAQKQATAPEASTAAVDESPVAGGEPDDSLSRSSLADEFADEDFDFMESTTIEEPAADILPNVEEPSSVGTALTVQNRGVLAPARASATIPPAQPAGQGRQSVVQEGRRPAGISEPTAPPQLPPGGAPPAGRGGANPPPGGGLVPPGSPPPGGAPPPTGPQAPRSDLGTAGVADALAREEEQLARIGPLGRWMLSKPVIRNGATFLNPSLDLERRLHVAYNASNDVAKQLSTRFKGEERPFIDAIERAWDKAPPHYVGDPEWPGAGTWTDLGWNPTRYADVSPELRAALDALNAHRVARKVTPLRQQYGVEIHPFESEIPGAIYQPVVETTPDLLERLERTTASLGRSGRAKERIWDDPYDRWLAAKAKGEDITFETDGRVLSDLHSEALARMAGNNTFKLGSGGLKREEMVDLVAPGLREAKERAARRVTNLEGRMRTAMNQGRVAARDTRTVSGKMSRIERRAQAALNRANEFGDEFDDLFPRMAGRLQELGYQWRHLRDELVKRGAKVQEVEARHADFLAQYEEAVEQLDRLRTAYANVNPREYVRNTVTNLWYPAEQSAKIDGLMGRSAAEHTMFKALDEWRSMVLNLDASLVSVHHAIAAMMDPVVTYKTAKDTLRAVSDPKLMDELFANEQDLVEKFAFATGFEAPISKPVQPELRARGVERIPGVGPKVQRFNDNLYRGVWYRMYQQWKHDVALIQASHPGISEAKAMGEAAATIANVVPMRNQNRLGKTPLRQAGERATFISPSFLEAPVVLTKDALSGMVKLAKAGGTGRGVHWSDVSPREQLAMLRASTLMGTALTVSVMSAFVSAPFTGKNPGEAVAEVIDPRSGRFMSIILGDQGSIPIGGPLRSFFRAMSPKRVDGDWQWMGPWDYLKGRRSPALRAAWDQLEGEDFFGNQIDQSFGESLTATLASRLYYLGESALPIFAQEIMAGVRTDASPKEIALQTAAQIGGASLYPRRPTEEMDRIAQSKHGKDFYDLSRREQEAIKRSNPGLWERVVNLGSGNRKEAEAARRVLRSKQEERDERLLRGELTKDEWLNAYFDGQAELRARLAQIYGDEPMRESDIDNPFDAYIFAIQESTDPATGIVDWDAVELWRGQQAPEDQQYIADNTGVDRTPLAQVYRSVASVRAEMNKLPKYRGYTAEEARQIDELWQAVRNNARSADERDMLRAYGTVAGSQRGTKIGQGVLRRIRGRLPRTRDREKFAKAHPEVQLFQGTGPLNPQQLEALNLMVRRAEEQMAA